MSHTKHVAGAGAFLAPALAIVSLAFLSILLQVAHADSPVGPIRVGVHPYGIGINPETNTVYVSSIFSGTLSVINGSSRTVEDIIPIENSAEGVAVNPATNTVYVGVNYNCTVDAVDGSTNKVVARIHIDGGPGDIAVNPSDNMVYAVGVGSGCAPDDSSLYVINGTTNSVAGEIGVGTNPQGVDVNPVTDMVYVTNHGNDSVSVIDGRTNSVVDTIPVGHFPREVAVDPATDMIYVANHASQTVSVIDGKTNSVVDTIQIPSEPAGISVDTKTDKVYVGGYTSGTVYVINGTTNQLIQYVPVPGYSVGIEADSSTDTIYAADMSPIGPNSYPGFVSVIDGNKSSAQGVRALQVSTAQAGNTGTTVAPLAAATPSGIMIPLYIYPGSDWTEIIQEKKAHPSVPFVAIINPGDGPGSSMDSNYVSGIQQLQSSGITVLGYVYTGYGTRSPTTVQSNINSYNTWYHVNGIFFDEMGNTNGYQTYYSNLSNYAKSLGMSVTFGNPGTQTLSSYVGTEDNLCTYEDIGLPSISTLQTNTFNGQYPKSNFSMIALSVGLPSQSFVNSASAYEGYLFATDDGLPNPYDTLPSYFDTLISYLDTGVSANPPQPPTGLAATAASSSQINLSWVAPTNNGGSAITGYKIERSTNAGSIWSTIVANTASTSTYYSDSGLAANTTYSYRVSAINAVGTSQPSNIATATTQASSGGGGTPGPITLNRVIASGGTTVANKITIANFNASAGSNGILVVGISANNNRATTVTFGGVRLAKAVSSFYNNDAEFWYLVRSSGTGNVVVTMTGPTQAVVGAYSFSGINLTNPIPTHVAKHNSRPNSPTITMNAKHTGDLVLDLPSIYGGSTLGSPTCTQEWNVNVPDAITGASSTTVVSSPSKVTCAWTASPPELYDDVAIELRSSQ